ncbi:MAG TPA: hypothetical protein PKL83_02140 [bacterium]|nr:hypothetical protein [bacterium]
MKRATEKASHYLQVVWIALVSLLVWAAVSGVTAAYSEATDPAGTVFITWPADGEILTGKITVEAQTDADTDKVEFYLQPEQASDMEYLGRGQKAGAALWIFEWDTTFTADGSYTLFPRKYTSAGTLVMGESVAVTVENTANDDDPADSDPDGTDQNPDETNNTFTILSPAADSNQTDAFSVAAADTGLAATRFYLRDSTAENVYYLGNGEKNAQGLWEITASLTRIPAGSYSLYAVGEDAQGNQVQTDTIRITIQGNASTDVVVDPGMVADDRLSEVTASEMAALMPKNANQGQDAQQLMRLPVLANVQVSSVQLKRGTGDAATEEILDRVIFAGHAMPDVTVTLHVFSDPIIATTKTDENGNWVYVLENGLEEGTHEVYIAVNDANDKPVGRSALYEFFVSTAMAADNQLEQITDAGRGSSSWMLRTYMFIAVGVVVLLSVSVFILHRLSKRKTA